MSFELKEINKPTTGFFRFKELNGRYLLTNDIGEYSFLDSLSFNKFLEGKIEKFNPVKFLELQRKSFIRDKLNYDSFAEKYARKNIFLNQGTSLNIVVVTLRCDHKCIYCQSGAKDINLKQYDMDIPTAQKVVDSIFSLPNQDVVIEFQGGEPLVNWNVVKFIIEYAHKKNKTLKKKLIICLVSNFAFMSEEKLKFFIKHNVSLCTSLDGPEFLHNQYRRSRINSQKNTLKWVRRVQKVIKTNSKYKYKINALTTITRLSLPYPKQIIDEFVKLGLRVVHLRPIQPFGIKRAIWEKINFSPEEFINFYQKAMDYIITINLKGKIFSEKTAEIFLTKILTENDSNYLDIRSPCGAGVGQLAYNFNGDVYTCDEARMLSIQGDRSFYIGNVFKNKPPDFINNTTVKTLCSASCLDALAGCSECVYKPYCGVCPIYNYVIGGNIFSQQPNNEKCRIQKGILDYLFERVEDKRIRDIFLKWLKQRKGFQNA